MDSRFGWVASGKSRGPNDKCDIPLLSIPEGVVIPSVGALLPGWLLIVPRERALSYAELDTANRQTLYHLARSVASEVSDFGSPIMLEHGAATAGSGIGCGVDQAHLHVVPIQFDLSKQVLADPTVAWSSVSPDDPWTS